MINAGLRPEEMELINKFRRLNGLNQERIDERVNVLLEEQEAHRMRNRLTYPENWEKYYELFVNKEISIDEFRKLAGVKIATLYNLITQYREDLSRE